MKLNVITIENEIAKENESNSVIELYYSEHNNANDLRDMWEMYEHSKGMINWGYVKWCERNGFTSDIPTVKPYDEWIAEWRANNAHYFVA